MPTLTKQVSAVNNDCRRRLEPSDWHLNTLWLRAGGGSGIYYKNGCGMRFTNVTIPSGSLITQAYLTLQCRTGTSATVVRTTISAEDADNTSVFADSSSAFDTRWANRTSATVGWDGISAWTTGQDYNSSDITTVIAEVIAREGWESGNAITIFWEDFAGESDQPDHLEPVTYRSAVSYSESSANAPKLIIVYTELPTAATNAATNILDISATLNGTVTADGGEACTYRFRYKVSGGEYTYTTLAGSVETDATFSEAITGLTEGTTYCFNAQLHNSIGYSAWGDEETFTTMEVTTKPVTRIETTTARLNGTVTQDGGEACQYRFRYREAFTSNSYTNTTWTGSKETGETFYEDITSLTEDTCYEFAAQIKNTAGESEWGDTLYFKAGTRSYTLPPIYDEKGRVPKGARVEARRSDTGTVVETETLNSSGQATFTDLPNDTDVTFYITWGGTTQAHKMELSYSGITGVAEGGTGSSSASAARANLGLEIGTNVQAWDGDLDDIAALTPTDSNIIVGDGTDWVKESGATARTSLGLGTGDSPQFTGIELGHATDTTITRVSAAKIAVEGTVLVRPANYVVAANGAPTHVKAQADYVCDATDDHVQIQAAIDALPATGGKVLLTEGTFNVESAITLDSYQTLQGMGRNTILTTTTADVDIIRATGGSGTEKAGILLADFCVDGNAGEATNDCGIEWEYVDHSKIMNVWAIDNGEHGIVLYECSDDIVIANDCNSNSDSGLYIYGSRLTVIGNTCNSNTERGIYVTDTYDSTVSGNTCVGNTLEGIYSGCLYNSVVTQNTCNKNGTSGMLGSFEECNLGFNSCSYNEQHGLNLTGVADSGIVGNTCVGNSQGTTNTYDDIFAYGVDYCIISNNVCRAGDETNKPRCGINISDATSNNNKVINNDLYDDGFVTGAYNNDGTDTIYLDPGTTETAVGQAHTQLCEAADFTKLDGIEASAVALATVKADADVADAISKKHTQGTDTTLGTLTADINMGGKDITNLNTSGGNAVGSTTAAWSLYVDAGSGSDENAGTSGSPKATIQGALDVLPINVAHAGSIKVRGPQNYAESNTALDFSRLSTLAAITIKTVNSSDEDMYDNGVADAGAGNNELDDATKDWAVDQFNGAYVWISHGTGEGQIREISDTTATKLTVTVNWTTNPDGTSYYAIGGGATLTGTDLFHVDNTGKLVNVYGFKHTGATHTDIIVRSGGNSNIGYNYFATSVRGIFALWLGILAGPDPQYNYSAATTEGISVASLAYGVIRGNVITGATKGIRIYYKGMVAGSATAYRQNHIMNCTVGISIESDTGMTEASSQSFGAGGDANGADIDPAVSTTIPRWYD